MGVRVFNTGDDRRKDIEQSTADRGMDNWTEKRRGTLSVSCPKYPLVGVSLACF